MSEEAEIAALRQQLAEWKENADDWRYKHEYQSKLAEALRKERDEVKQQFASQAAELERLRKENVALQSAVDCGDGGLEQAADELATLRERLEAAEKMLCQCGTQDEPTLARFEHAGFYVDIDRYDDGWWAVRFRYTSIERKGPHGSPIEAYQFAIAQGWLPPASTKNEPPKGQ